MAHPGLLNRLLLPLCASVLTAGLAAAGSIHPHRGPQEPDRARSEALEWLLVHGETERFGRLTLAEIGRIYLGRFRWEACADDETERVAAHHGALFVVGNLVDNALAADLAGDVLEQRDDGWYHRERKLEPGFGVVVSGARANGMRVCVFTGIDDAGVYQCFTTPIDVQGTVVQVVRDGKVLSDWGRARNVFNDPAVAARPLVHDPGSDALALLTSAEPARPELTAEERASLAARRLFAYRDEWRLIVPGVPAPGLDALASRLELLRDREAARLDAVHGWLAGKDLPAEIARTWRVTTQRLGAGAQPAPAVFVLLDLPRATNARTAGRDFASGRPRIVVNLACFPDESSFHLALIHEFVHVLQQDEAGRLVDDPLLLEGVAVFLTTRLLPEAPLSAAMMWEPGRLEAARQAEAEAAAAYRAVQTDAPDRLRSWFLLGERPQSARTDRSGQAVRTDLPDRMGYWLGYRAAAAWHAAHEAATLSEMLRLDAGAFDSFLPDRLVVGDGD